ncbi:MAG: hypothetical protein ACREI8_04560 [Myxococcota bacterium]
MKRAVIGLGVAIVAISAGAEDSARMEALERRVEQLEAELVQERIEDAKDKRLEEASWTDRIRLSGSAEIGHYDGQENALTHDAGYQVWDARVFLDAELAEDIRFGSSPLVRNIGFTGEWNLVRLGEVQNDVGDLYVDLQGIVGSSWLNLRPGRFQAPVGEAYKRYSRGTPRNPFISNTVGGPWWWDEGVMLYGASGEGLLGYVASLTDGETPFGYDDGSGEQATLKLWTQPLEWLYLSVSGLHTGEIGDGTGALWLGETWPIPIGSDTDIPTYANGIEQADATGGFERSWLAGGDVVITPTDWLRLWLGYGRYQLDAQAGTAYDRTLHYGIAELVVGGSLLGPAFAPGYVGVRADTLGTFDSGEGFLLDYGYGNTLGYDMESLWAYSAVVGWKLGSFTTLRAEYSLRDIDLVRGAPASLREEAGDADTFAVELGIEF